MNTKEMHFRYWCEIRDIPFWTHWLFFLWRSCMKHVLLDLYRWPQGDHLFEIELQLLCRYVSPLYLSLSLWLSVLFEAQGLYTQCIAMPNWAWLGLRLSWNDSLQSSFDRVRIGAIDKFGWRSLFSLDMHNHCEVENAFSASSLSLLVGIGISRSCLCLCCCSIQLVLHGCWEETAEENLAISHLAGLGLTSNQNVNSQTLG